jgi:hypothetical protein
LILWRKWNVGTPEEQDEFKRPHWEVFSKLLMVARLWLGNCSRVTHQARRLRKAIQWMKKLDISTTLW